MPADNGTPSASHACRRDASRDGLRNRLETWLLTNLAPLWRVVNASPTLAAGVNKILINNAVNKTRNRPHPFSTMSRYTSWPSLTDQEWNARHLPAFTWQNLPPVEEVVNLFRRPSSGMSESPKSTYLFASFAQWFTDGFLRTLDGDRRRNDSSHQIDLNQLYGSTLAATNNVRVLGDKPGERGRLKWQSVDGKAFAPFLYEDDGVTRRAGFEALPEPARLQPEWPREKRATLFAFGGDRSNATSQTAMLNTLFLREHNRLCGVMEKRHGDWDGDRVFQTARNTLIAMLIKIVVEEYVNHIAPYHYRFRGDPRVAWTARWNRPNWIAVEFNLLYRWHGLVPDFLVWDGETVPVGEMVLNNEPLLVSGLSRAFETTSRQAAGVISALNTPNFLLPAEARGIQQARDSELAPYNDYREAMSYPRVTAFEQISGDPTVVEILRSLYRVPDNVEYYAGIFAEDVRENAALSPLIGRMVGIEAFSHALTNPLLSEHVFNENTFGAAGWEAIQSTASLQDLVSRNVSGEPLVTMTRPDWVSS